MTDSILRSYQAYSYTSIVPFAAAVAAAGALALLDGETEGFAIDATTADGGTVAVISLVDPTDNLSNVIMDASNLVQSGTSPKMVHHLSSPYVRWSPHNMFLNSGAPATQNVALVVGFVYTVTVTGAGGGSITGSAGASGVATTGSPATFTATTTTGTFTYAATLTTIQLNRGAVATPYLATTGAIRIGIPQSYDAAASKYGILVEPAAITLQGRSEEFNTSWALAGVAIAADDATSPDGATTADKFTESSGGSGHQVYQQSTSSSGTDYALSIYVKAGTNSYVQLLWQGSSGNNYITAIWDITNGTLGETSVGGTSGTISSTSITSIGGGWFRLALTGRVTSANAYYVISPATAASGNSFSATGDITFSGTSRTFYCWGAQLEDGTVATSYILTLASSVTRAKDSISALATTFPLGATARTHLLYMKDINTPTGKTYLTSGQNTGGADNAGIYVSSLAVKSFYTDGGATQADFSIGSITLGTSFKVAARYTTNDFHGALNGTLSGAPDTSGTFNCTLDEMRLGYPADEFAHAWYYQIVILPRAYSDTELQAETT